MIELDGVTKEFATTRALDDVSFSVSRGELSFLVGPSGSGKTTVLRLLSREILPDRGVVRVGGADLSLLPVGKVPTLRRHVAVIPQDLRLLQNRTVAGNIVFALAVLGWPTKAARRRVTEVLEIVGMDGYAERIPSELSGGELQRVAIARAVAGSPAVILADEPTGNLDPAGSVGIVRLLEHITTMGTTVVMSTHDQSVVDAMRNQVVALDAGRLVRDDRHGRYVAGTR